MLVLGIESSCDETALALADDFSVKSSVLSSQADLHSLFGGVVPELASREHTRLIGRLYSQLLISSQISPHDIDYIAVTRGPGLLGSLLVGVSFAKALAFSLSKPLIGVNHLEAHLLAADLEKKLSFPALGVLISGGHTHLYKMNSPVSMELLGKTLDDAAGEALDKFAKTIGLPYPGGALLDQLAQKGKPIPGLFPRPYTNNDNLNFSFSGLKTAGALWIADHPEYRFLSGDTPPKEKISHAQEKLCNAVASYITSIAETLVIKASRALTLFQPQSIVVAGGVAANSIIRTYFKNFAEKHNLSLFIPSLKLCGDNAVMVARAGLYLAEHGYCHDLTLKPIPRGQAIPQDFLTLS